MSFNNCFILVISFLMISLFSVNAQSVTGTNGLIHIPTAEMFKDKTFIIGASLIPKPYFQRFDRRINPGMPTYLNITLFPFMEVMFRYTNELNMKVNPTTKYYPDRMMTFRFRVLNEKRSIPSIVLGFQDITKALGLSCSSCNNYSASYIVGTKTFTKKSWSLKTSLGYAYDLKDLKSEDFKGLFGGIEVQNINHANTSLMAEFNSFHPIVGVQHFFFNKIKIMFGVWDLKKFTTSFNYHILL